MEEIKLKIKPDLLLEHLRVFLITNELISTAGCAELSSKFEEKMDVDEIELKMEPDGYPNLHLEENGVTTDTSAESSQEFKIFKIPKTEVEEISYDFEILPDSESNCVETKEENEEKYTPPPELDPVLFCNPELLSTKNQKAAKLVKCSKCAMEFPKNTNLQKHMRAAHKKKFVCSVCQKQFMDKLHLHRHKLKVHYINDEETEESAVKVPPVRAVVKKQCSKCDLTFTTAFRLQNHEYSAHPVKKEFQCSTCDLKFSSENIKQLHEKFTHPVKNVSPKSPFSIPEDSASCSENIFYPDKRKHEGNFQCPRCPSNFGTLRSLHLHNRVHTEPYESWADHENLLNFNCSKCSETFLKVSKVISHKKCHGDKYPCKICPGIFATKYYLLTHRRIAHPELTGIAGCKCRICPQLFTTPEEQNEHEKCHGEWPCNFCPAVLQSQQARTLHTLNVHPEQKQLKCSKCELTFSSTWRRQAHMKKHKKTIRLIIKCKICDITFPTLFEQARHKEEFHSQPVSQIISKPKKKNFTFRKKFKLNPEFIHCPLCSKVFLSKNSLINHKNWMHSQNQQRTKGKKKRSDLMEESSSRDRDLTTVLSVDSVKTEPILKSVVRTNPEEVVMPDDVKQEFIWEQSKPEDPILGI